MERIRVVVVGAGVAGLSTAFALARDGAAVTLVDAGEAGQATAAGAGIVQPWSSATDGPLYDIYSAGAPFYTTVVEQLAEVGVHDIAYRRCGALIVNADAAVLDAVEVRVRTRATAAPFVGEVTRLDNADARRLFPPLAHDLDGLHISGGARVDGRLLADALRSAFVRLGGVSTVGRATLREDRGSIRLIVDHAIVAADAIVLTVGAWTNRVLAPIRRRIGVEPQRGQISHLRLDGQDTSRWPSISPMSDHYMVAFDDSRVVVGATRETGSGFDPRITAAGQRHVLDNALRLAPGLGDATLIETRVGLRPLPDDGLPVIGRLPDTEHIYVASGYGALGLTIAPFAGRQLAQLILAERSEFDLGPFAPAPARIV